RLEKELVDLRKEIEKTADAVRTSGLEPLDWGDLRRVVPFSRQAPEGQPGEIYRHYTRAFLERYRPALKGRILEVDRTSLSLKEGEAVPENSLDGVVLVNTLRYEYDLHGALARWRDMLKPGGVLLATFSSVSAVPREGWEMESDYWRFTE